jgi:benzoate/toluate 1,2-dioxygenase reductase subunit
MICDNPMLLESYRRLDVHAQMAAAFETGTRDLRTRHAGPP